MKTLFVILSLFVMSPSYSQGRASDNLSSVKKIGMDLRDIKLKILEMSNDKVVNLHAEEMLNLLSDLDLKVSTVKLGLKRLVNNQGFSITVDSKSISLSSISYDFFSKACKSVSGRYKNVGDRVRANLKGQCQRSNTRCDFSLMILKGVFVNTHSNNYTCKVSGRVKPARL